MHFNRVLLGGNLTRDPEQRFTPSGTAITTFTVANNRKWWDGNGELREEVSFLDCTAFGKTAENICQYFKKGQAIFVEGRLKQDTWEDKQTGQKRSKIKIDVSGFSFVGSSVGEGRGAPAGTPSRRDDYRQTVQNQQSQEGEPEEDDVPFAKPLPSVCRRMLGIPSFNKMA